MIEEQARKVAQYNANDTGNPWMIYREVGSGEFDAGTAEVITRYLRTLPDDSVDSVETIYLKIGTELSEERSHLSAMAVDAVTGAKESPGMPISIHVESGIHAEIIYKEASDLWYITGYDNGMYVVEAVSMLEYILTRPALSRQDGGGEKLPTPAEMFDLLNFAYTTLSQARESYYFEDERLTRRKRELEDQEAKLRANGALDLGEKATDTQRKAKLFDLTAPERALVDSAKDGANEAAYKLKMAEDEVARARANLRILELASGIDRDNHR